MLVIEPLPGVDDPCCIMWKSPDMSEVLYTRLSIIDVGRILGCWRRRVFEARSVVCGS